MSESSKRRTMKTSEVLGCLLGGIVIGMMLGAYVSSLITPVRYVEIQPSSPDKTVQLDFYVDYLRSHNITVTEKELSVFDYKNIPDFKTFLWFLETANLTECFVDHGATEFLGRSGKLWFPYDGNYWELRF